MHWSGVGQDLNEAIETMEAVDAYTVRIQLEERIGTVLTSLALDNQGPVIYPKSLNR